MGLGVVPGIDVSLSPVLETSGRHSIKPEVYDRSRLDDVMVMDDAEAFEMTRRLAAEEGIFAGMSSGAAVAGALRIAQKMTSGTIVALLPDRGDRYLSTMLFMSVCAKCPP